VSYEIFSAQTR